MARTLSPCLLARMFGLLLTLNLFATAQVGAQATLRLEDELAVANDFGAGGNQFASYGQPSPSCQKCWEDQCPVKGADRVPRTWGRAEYLWWETKGNTLPELVDSGPSVGNTTTVFGGDEIDDEFRSGLRVGGGLWLDDCHNTGVEVSYFVVFDDRRSGDFFARTQAAGVPVIERPFVQVPPGAAGPLYVSAPGVADGQIDISSRSEMQSGSVLLRRCFRRGSRGEVDLIGGYRYFGFREGMLFEQVSTSTDASTTASLPLGTVISISDRFVAENDFHGGELGFVADFGSGALGLELLAKVAIGNVHRLVTIDGTTRIQPPVPPEASGVGGFLALNGTNIGQRTQNDFALLPEFGANLKYAITDRVSILGGATLLMLNDVVRTGEQIDTSINSTYFVNQVPSGEARPARRDAHVTDFWAAGFNVGIQLEM
jgi:hypothetical protein